MLPAGVYLYLVAADWPLTHSLEGFLPGLSVDALTTVWGRRFFMGMGVARKLNSAHSIPADHRRVPAVCRHLVANPSAQAEWAIFRSENARHGFDMLYLTANSQGASDG